jgi:hypothetical protein
MRRVVESKFRVRVHRVIGECSEVRKGINDIVDSIIMTRRSVDDIEWCARRSARGESVLTLDCPAH